MMDRPEAANNMLKAVRQVYKYAMAHEDFDYNPAIGVSYTPKQRRRDNRLMNAIVCLSVALDRYETGVKRVVHDGFYTCHADPPAFGVAQPATIHFFMQ